MDPRDAQVQSTPRINAVALRVCGLGSLNGDGAGAGSGGLGPGVVFGPFEPVVGHLAFDDVGLAAQASER
jgi:hypothetical protein